MANISNIIFCLNTTNLPGQGVSANTILSALTPDYVPGLFTFSVVITVLDLDMSVGHNVIIDFANEKESVAHIEGSFPVMEVDNTLPKEYQGLNLSMDWTNVNFKEGGLYTLKVNIDGADVGEKAIYVKGKNQK